jgi:hypothetical protein
MSHKPNENDDDNRTAASDFVKIEQPDEVPGQEAQQEEHFDLHQNPLLDWTMKTESTSAAADDNDGNDLKELKVMIAKLEVCRGNNLIFIYILGTLSLYIFKLVLIIYGHCYIFLIKLIIYRPRIKRFRIKWKILK